MLKSYKKFHRKKLNIVWVDFLWVNWTKWKMLAGQNKSEFHKILPEFYFREEKLL